jgi:hypothetical protein
MNTDNSPDLDRIAAAWIAYQQWAAARPSQDSSRCRTLAEFADEDAESERNGFWAWDTVDSLVHKQPEQAWLLIVRLVELSNDDRMLATVAAGPLEDLLGSHPYEFIDRLERQSRTDAKFRRCVSGVWGWSSIPEDVQLRMRRTWEGEEPL